ncbi:MAG: hypothetical protein M0Z30_07460 [Actinomycetota bacterium]|nr:hypothetical protein [Actinomycetota bacterium]
MSNDSADEIFLDEALALRGTRHLVLSELRRRVAEVERDSDRCDVECDRALMEAWRLLKWVEGRMTRNRAAP